MPYIPREYNVTLDCRDLPKALPLKDIQSSSSITGPAAWPILLCMSPQSVNISTAFICYFRGFGGSSGAIRNWVSPKRHVEDWMTSIDAVQVSHT